MGGMQDPHDRRRYIIVLTKFIIQFVEVGMIKSFGVLIPTMVYVFSTDVSSLGLVCSMPTSMMLLSSLPMAYVLKSGRISPRMMAILGAVISSLGIIIAGHLTSVIALGFCLAITGIGLSMGYLPVKVLLNEYFQERFILVNAIANLGCTTGAMVAPVIIERALQAYGYSGAMMILGGISLHGVVASTALKTVNDPRKYSRIEKERKDSQEIAEDIPLVDPDHNQSVYTTAPDCERGGSDDNAASSEESTQNQEDHIGKKSANDEVLPRRQRLLHWIRRCIIVEEPLLLLSLPCRFIMSFVNQAWILFLVPKAEWRGIPRSKAVLLSTIGGGAGVIGRFLSIALLYFGADFIVVYLILSLVTTATFLIDPLLTSFPAMCASAFIQGLFVFSSSTSSNAFLKGSVSNENFTVAAGIYGLVQGLGASIGSLLSGMIKDKTESYSAVFVTLGVMTCVTVLITVAFIVARRRRNVPKA